MICAVHALVGAAVGKWAGSHGKAAAAGVSTHFLGDLLPHKDFDPKTEAPLLVVTLGLLAWRFGVRSPEFAGALAGVAPDFENMARIAGLMPASAMRFPSHVGEGKFHGRMVESAWPQGVLAVLCVAYLLRGDVPSPTDAP